MNSRRVNPILRRNPSGNPGASFSYLAGETRFRNQGASFSYPRRNTFGNPQKKS